jgi:flagellar basal body-associated protein FliL
MRGLRPLLFISIPIVVVLAAMLIIISITGTGDKAEKDRRSLPPYSNPTAVYATATPVR